MRSRAVQDFSPSESVDFFDLKKRAAREALATVDGAPASPELHSSLEARVDALALSAFETYTRCREELFEIRLRSTQRRVAVLLERFGGSTAEGGTEDITEETDHPEEGG